MRGPLFLGAALFSLFAALGCSQGLGDRCVQDSDCASGLICSNRTPMGGVCESTTTVVTTGAGGSIGAAGAGGQPGAAGAGGQPDAGGAGGQPDAGGLGGAGGQAGAGGAAGQAGTPLDAGSDH
jgi:hypothetical protein